MTITSGKSEDAANVHAASIGGDAGHLALPGFYNQTCVWEHHLTADGCKEPHPKVLLINISTFSNTRNDLILNVLILQSTESHDVYQRLGCLNMYAVYFGSTVEHPDWTTREITII
ncbi:uncharacterized protein EAE97_004891 [Botrytis byssoidea]|uniref:Uncharacterized protein n=1 Tax=Botrytis byssoidea TaxID=139641 RepID=A0A9P5IU17_9HELO|nr:uncharacterized protein EAE97_004891 [Botrytis byssoidea]KAF7945853.1 hypothetical protein EAE97_004891 [Botrytis byssoidea]